MTKAGESILRGVRESLDYAEGAMKIEMEGVREYAEHMPVTLSVETKDNRVWNPELKDWADMPRRLVVVALNEGGYNSTAIDLEDLLHWLSNNKDKIEQFKS